MLRKMSGSVIQEVRSLTHSIPTHMSPLQAGVLYAQHHPQWTPVYFNPRRSLAMKSALIEVENQTKKVKEHLFKIQNSHLFEDRKAVARIYKLIKNPDASEELLEHQISSAPLPIFTKILLNQLANRDLFKISHLNVLPDIHEVQAKRKESAEEIEFKMIQTNLRSKGHTVFINTRSTLHPQGNIGEYAPSQITAISFDEQHRMYVRVNSYNSQGHPEECFTTTYSVKDRLDQYIILQMFSGKISAHTAMQQVTGLFESFHEDDSAKFLCYINPGNTKSKKIPKAVIDSTLQKDLEQILAPFAQAAKTRAEKIPLFLAFDNVASIISKGKAEYHSTSVFADIQFRIIQLIINSLTETCQLRLFSYEKIAESNVEFKFNGNTEQNKLFQEALLNLKKQITCGWERDEDAFIKKFGNKIPFYLGLCFHRFAQLADISDAYNDEKPTSIRINGLTNFLKFQKAVCGGDEIVELSKDGLGLTAKMKDGESEIRLRPS